MELFELMLLNQKVITDFQEKMKKNLSFQTIVNIPDFTRTKAGDDDYKRYMRMTQEKRDDIIMKSFGEFYDELDELVEVHTQKMGFGIVPYSPYVPLYGLTKEEWIKQIQAIDSQKMVSTMRRNPELLRSNNAKTMKNAVDVVQTTSNALINFINLAVWQKDPSIDRVVSRAVIDGRTTPLCMSLNGKVWKKSDPSINVPPRHYNCRSWLENINTGEKVDMRTPEEIFNKLSPKRQQRIAGKQGREMINSGKYKMSDIVSKITGERLTVNQLKKLD